MIVALDANIVIYLIEADAVWAPKAVSPPPGKNRWPPATF